MQTKDVRNRKATAGNRIPKTAQKAPLDKALGMDMPTRRQLWKQSAICFGISVVITALGIYFAHGQPHVRLCSDGKYTSFGASLWGLVLLVPVLFAPAGFLLCAVKTKDKEFGLVCGLLYIVAGCVLAMFSYHWFNLMGCPTD